MNQASVSLKSLRTDPRGFVDLLNQGYEVTITEHRRVLANAQGLATKVSPRKGDAQALLDYLKSRPKVKTPFPNEDTVKLMKRTRLEYLERKAGYDK